MNSESVGTSNGLEELTPLATQQRRKLLEDLIQLRKNDFAYLSAVHLAPDQSFYLNVALLKEENLNLTSTMSAENHHRRCQQLFYLGVSLGKLLEVSSPTHIATEGCQLLEELEFYLLPSTLQNMKLVVMPKSSFYERPSEVKSRENDKITELHSPALCKWNHKPVYRRLLTPNISFPLDYCQLVVTLCETLTLVYSALMGGCCSNPFVFQAIFRFDAKIKKLFLDSLTKQLMLVSMDMIKTELESLQTSL